MDASEIMQLVERNEILKNAVHGVYAKDTIPTGRHFIPGKYIIINTEVRASRGRHWTIATRTSDEPDVVLFYDSLGAPPSDYGIFFHGLRTVFFNDVVVQSSDSKLCGLFCLDFAYWSSVGVSMALILTRFNENLARNDHIVRLSAARIFL